MRHTLSYARPAHDRLILDGTFRGPHDPRRALARATATSVDAWLSLGSGLPVQPVETRRVGAGDSVEAWSFSSESSAGSSIGGLARSHRWRDRDRTGSITMDHEYCDLIASGTRTWLAFRHPRVVPLLSMSPLLPRLVIASVPTNAGHRSRTRRSSSRMPASIEKRGPSARSSRSRTRSRRWRRSIATSCTGARTPNRSSSGSMDTLAFAHRSRT